MRVRVIHVKKRRSGTARRVETFDTPSLIIGRNVGSAIVLDGLSVSLAHATVRLSGSELSIAAIDDATVFVRGRAIHGPVRLYAGDEIGICGYELRVVEVPEPAIDVCLEVERLEVERLEVEEDARSELQKRTRVGIQGGLLARRPLSWLAVVALLGIGLAYPLSTTSKNFWNSGPISNNHAYVAEECTACHVPFVHVPDSKCVSCHSRIESHTSPENAALVEGSCAGCHLEHNGSEGLAELQDAGCAFCHGSITDKYPEVQLARAAGFTKDDHPDFSLDILIPAARGATPNVQSKSWKDRRDSSGLKFPHLLHVGGVRINDLAKARVESVPFERGDNSNLRCDVCHLPDSAGESMRPIEFERHCRGCHRLTFDNLEPSLKGEGAVHARPGELKRDLRRAYLNALIKIEGGETRDERSRRIFEYIRPGRKLNEEQQLILEKVESKVESAFSLLMSDRYCGECHVLVGDELEEDYFDVEPVALTTNWYSGAKFSHEAHSPFQCASCHPGASVHDDEFEELYRPFVRADRTMRNEIPYGLWTRGELIGATVKDIAAKADLGASGKLIPSEDAADVLIPGKMTCLECHGAENAQPPKVASGCVSCHVFHRDGFLPMRSTKTSSEISLNSRSK